MCLKDDIKKKLAKKSCFLVLNFFVHDDHMYMYFLHAEIPILSN